MNEANWAIEAAIKVVFSEHWGMWNCPYNILKDDGTQLTIKAGYPLVNSHKKLHYTLIKLVDYRLIARRVSCNHESTVLFLCVQLVTL